MSEFTFDRPMIDAPTVTRHDDGQLEINWRGPRPAGWLKVDTEVIQQLIDERNAIVRENARLVKAVKQLEPFAPKASA